MYLDIEDLIYSICSICSIRCNCYTFSILLMADYNIRILCIIDCLNTFVNANVFNTQ